MKKEGQIEGQEGQIEGQIEGQEGQDEEKIGELKDL